MQTPGFHLWLTNLCWRMSPIAFTVCRIPYLEVMRPRISILVSLRFSSDLQVQSHVFTMTRMLHIPGSHRFEVESNSSVILQKTISYVMNVTRSMMVECHFLIHPNQILSAIRRQRSKVHQCCCRGRGDGGLASSMVALDKEFNSLCN